MAFALLAAALGGVGSPVAKAGAQAKPDRRDPAPIASVTSHSEPFHSSLPASLDKAYPELAGASHVAPNSPNTTIAKYSVSWLKRFVDNDTRYEQSPPSCQWWRWWCWLGL